MDKTLVDYARRMEEWRAKHRASWKPGWREEVAARSHPADEWTPGVVPPEIRAEVFARDGERCALCGSDEDPTLDHITPISRGGEHSASNLQVLCRSCNAAKSNMTMDEWLATDPRNRPRREKSAPGPNPPRYCLTCEQERRGARVNKAICCVCGEPLPLAASFASLAPTGLPF